MVSASYWDCQRPLLLISMSVSMIIHSDKVVVTSKIENGFPTCSEPMAKMMAAATETNILMPMLSSDCGRRKMTQERKNSKACTPLFGSEGIDVVQGVFAGLDAVFWPQRAGHCRFRWVDREDG